MAAALHAPSSPRAPPLEARLPLPLELSSTNSTANGKGRGDRDAWLPPPPPSSPAAADGDGTAGGIDSTALAVIIALGAALVVTLLCVAALLVRRRRPPSRGGSNGGGACSSTAINVSGAVDSVGTAAMSGTATSGVSSWLSNSGTANQTDRARDGSCSSAELSEESSEFRPTASQSVDDQVGSRG